MANHSPKLLGMKVQDHNDSTCEKKKENKKKEKKEHELTSAIHTMMDLVLLNSLAQMKLKKEANRIVKK